MGTGWFFNRDKPSLDIFWLRDESLEESDNLPDPGRSRPALEQFCEIGGDLGGMDPKLANASGKLFRHWRVGPSQLLDLPT
ncbi:MAG: hypothetical protein ACREQ7_22295 [Candidatus Binatia bacterium]